ncbi:Peptidase M1 membrane alanine aminopeptidase [Halothece sp. PCC 7418]|uniref:M1 family metallopeptidase n=1 Tax=Halothece sp. (strain PCC 7418) TaxID=65093 RepID=UPI0002A0836E|nr:M1 family metallopeptidase [Halothece sp. PCC 7418]AFZ44444.1 Peptidase M1 membrane alanine aminopeptidase [Halothece sp. PCC 7418]
MKYNYFLFDTEENGRKSFILPGAKPHYTPDRPGNVQHIFLDLVLDIPNQSFRGSSTITLKPVQSGLTHLTLDAEDLTIESVQIKSVSQPFHYDGKQLQIQLLQPTTFDPIDLVIHYRVDHPQRGLYFIQPDKDYPDKPTQVWTQGEDEDSRFWFPCFDYPGQLATSEIRVEVPKPYVAVSNGELVATEEKGENTIYHWRQNQVHPTYLMTLAVGDFAKIEDQWKDIPVEYYVEKGREDDAKRTMGKTPQMIEFFSQQFGYAYPYPKYAQVCVADFIFGGMENTSTTLLTDRCLLDDRARLDKQRSETLVAHELAHQWFGDLLVIKHWSHAWIKEGMASYSEVLWTDHEYSQDDAAYYILNEARSYLNEDSSRYRRPIVTNIYREAIELYDRHLYEKGACVYHMIRGELGEEAFTQAIHNFVQKNAHRTVETVDLLRAIDEVTGKNLSPLFDQYVFRGGHPDFKVSYSWDAQDNLAKLTVTQTQGKTDKDVTENELFDLKIPVGFGYVSDNGEVCFETMSLHLHEKEHNFYFPLPQQPQFISFDQGNYYLKTVTLEYPTEELKTQLKYDPDVTSRIYAAEALGKKGGLEVIKALAESLTQDPFWGVRLEVAKQLGKIKLQQAIPELINGLSDEHPKVRRTILEGLANFKTEESYQAVKLIAQEGDPSYYTEAVAFRMLGKMATGNLKEKEAEVIDLFRQGLENRAGWNEVVRGGIIGGLSEMKTSETAMGMILPYTYAGIPQPLRLAAIRALGTISTGQEQAQLEAILEQLDALSGESFFLTQVSVVTALKQMQTSQAISILQTLADQTPDGRVRRMAEEAVKTVQGNLGSDKAVKELREEFDRLKQENQELMSRLAKLEAQQSDSK